MAENTHIEWATHTFNPWWGCTKVSDACKNCYADNLSQRYGRAKWGPLGTRVRTSPANWKLPLKWEKEAAASGVRPRVFCASMSDVFEGSDTCQDPTQYEIIISARADLMRMIEATPNLDWLLLTKRPANANLYLRNLYSKLCIDCFPNVWVGTSVGTRKDKGLIDDLRQVPAVLRFLSLEPLVEDLGEIDLTGIGWGIVGGESQSGARPMRIDWARSLRDRFTLAQIPFLFKQWGDWCPGLAQTNWAELQNGTTPAISTTDTKNYEWGNGWWSVRVGVKAAGRLLDGRDWTQFPEVTS